MALGLIAGIIGLFAGLISKGVGWSKFASILIGGVVFILFYFQAGILALSIPWYVFVVVLLIFIFIKKK